MKSNQLKLVGGLIIAGAVVLGGIGFLLWKGVPQLFQSTAVVRVVRDQTDLEQLGDLAPAGTDTAVFLQNEAQSILADAVLERVVTNLGLTTSWGVSFNEGTPLSQTEVMLRLREWVQVTPDAVDPLLRIHAASPIREESPKLADALAAAYCEYRVDRRRRIAQNAIDALAAPYAENMEKMQQARQQIEDARQALDPGLREQSLPPRPDAEASEQLRQQVSRLTMQYMTQSNQLARLAAIDPETRGKYEVQLANTRGELTSAVALLAAAAKQQEGLRAYWLAREELDKLETVFAPIRETVEKHQHDLTALDHRPALVESPATEAVELPSRMPLSALGLFGGAGILMLIGVATFRAAK